MGTYDGPGKEGEVVTMQSTEPLAGKYVVLQLMTEKGTLNLNEVKVMCAGEDLAVIL